MEDALKIALITRDKILQENSDTSSILRGCFVVASSLGDSKNIEWISNELSGYSKEREIPFYRDFISKKSGNFVVKDTVHRLEHVIKKGKELVIWDGKTDMSVNLEPDWCYSILSKVKDRCLMYLTNKIIELEYGGLISSIIDRMRTEIDNKLSKLSNEAIIELQSIYTILCGGKTEADWSKVAHSCRKVFKYVANNLFPPKDECYTDSEGKKHNVKEDDYMNRILAFIDMKKGDKIIKAEIKYLSSYLDRIRDFSGKGEHSKFDRIQAEQIAVHTYLILSDILRFVKILPL